MPLYEYKALNVKGKMTNGSIDCESIALARKKLRASDIFPVSIWEAAKEVQKTAESPFSNIILFSRIKPSDISMMTRQLATLVDAGFPLVSAMQTLIHQIQNPSLKNILAKIKENIEEGSSFAAALAQYPRVFTSIYINMVRAGEASGTLEIVLSRLADITENQMALNNKVRSALTYPILMITVATLIVVVMLTYIVPQITKIFSDMNQVLPLPTQILISTSDFLKSYWWFLVFLIMCAVAGFQYTKKTIKGRYFLDQSVFYIPVVGSLVKKLSIARFSRTLGSLLENGVPMLTALEVVKNIVGNVIISDVIENASVEVERGNSLGSALSTSTAFPHIAIQMIQVGEQSGELETLLDKVANIFESEVENSINSLTSLLDPLIIITMAIIVGFIVLSICLPIMEMNQLVK